MSEKKCKGSCPNTCMVHQGKFSYCDNGGCLCHSYRIEKTGVCVLHGRVMLHDGKCHDCRNEEHKPLTGELTENQKRLDAMANAHIEGVVGLTKSTIRFNENKCPICKGSGRIEKPMEFRQKWDAVAKSAATTLLLNGFSIRQVKKLLGFGSTRTIALLRKKIIGSSQYKP